MHEFDVVVIGSGPSAVAALDAMDADVTVAVLTGAVPSRVALRDVHPKIRAVATERGERPGIAEIVNSTGNTKLFATASVGGLANYWGQQFVAQSPGDAWPSQTFANYADYLGDCQRVEGLFTLRGGLDLENRQLGDDSYSQTCPRLLVGSSRDPDAGLGAMADAFRTVVGRRNAAAIDTRAVRLSQSGKSWNIALADGGEMRARRIILAAGVVGTALLLLRSWPELQSARFRDHSPWMVFCLGLWTSLSRGISGEHHFNVRTIERKIDDRCRIFASVYNMRNSELNLLLSSTLGVALPMFRGWRAPIGSELVTPVQVWTPSTESIVELEGERTTAKELTVEPHTDSDFMSLLSFLEANGARVVRVSRTGPGEGFHYHSLAFATTNGGEVTIDEALKDMSGDAIVCVDASVQKSIGCRPPTLTTMAMARRLTENSINSL